MAGETSVDRAAMATAAGQLQDAVDEVRAQQARLTSAHGTMMGGWTGDAASAFTAAYESFNADFTKVITAMQGIQTRLVGTRANYEASEQANVTSANKIAGLING
jgi:WXG100 family type VII secretion target